MLVYGCEMSLNGKKKRACTHFHVLCDGPLFDGKTTAITKKNYFDGFFRTHLAGLPNEGHPIREKTLP